MTSLRVRKAVFPVAGMGTRFLPATKAMPKEMLPVLDKPLIQYAVEEAAAAGIEQMIFVTGRNKRAIEDHFDRAPELEAQLAAAGKHDLLAQLMSATPRKPDTKWCVKMLPSTSADSSAASFSALEAMKASPVDCSVSVSLMVKGSTCLPPFSRKPAPDLHASTTTTRTSPMPVRMLFNRLNGSASLPSSSPSPSEWPEK
jgi:hypothetical protein